jgi:hypothetical protein
MDDALAFASASNYRPAARDSEELLIKKASKVFCSSENLANVLCSRYGKQARDKVSIIRNAVSDNFLKHANSVRHKTAGRERGDRLSLAYAGTVGDWFDFDTVLKCLAEHPQCDIHIFGPIEVENYPTHPRLIYHRPMQHLDLVDELINFDVLMMPFRLNSLIASVDPVKLYEYVAIGKEILAIYYKEIDRFGPFLHFYRSTEEFIETVGRLINGTATLKNADGLASSFLTQNTWANRLEQVFSNLEEIP